MKIKPRIRKVLSGMALVTALAAQAQVLQTQGEYLYGPETSEATACRLAVLAAKQKALARMVGEDLAIDQSYACSESDRDMTALKSLCTLNKYLWSQIRGEISSYRVLATQVSNEFGARKCMATVEADVRRLRESTAAFDFVVQLNAQTLRVGETVRMDIQPTGSGHLAVYNWLASERDDGNLIRVFPNSHQSASTLNAQLIIPNEDYDIVVGERGDSPGHVRPAAEIEHLVFVMTQQALKWPDRLSYNEFSRRVSEIDPAEVRIKKKTLSIVAK